MYIIHCLLYTCVCVGVCVVRSFTGLGMEYFAAGATYWNGNETEFHTKAWNGTGSGQNWNWT